MPSSGIMMIAAITRGITSASIGDNADGAHRVNLFGQLHRPDLRGKGASPSGPRP